ncbi:hypothetical protein [Serratia fonticola]|uniref:hypothetical protein n=1 Tax=Serratia fonticola TaxID=47917 RepID=UPI0011612BD2|nr:hypothetical protein [Serratia fonticola]
MAMILHYAAILSDVACISDGWRALVFMRTSGNKAINDFANPSTKRAMGAYVARGHNNIVPPLDIIHQHPLIPPTKYATD